MSENDESVIGERIRLAVEAGNAAEVERLVSSEWGVMWTAKRAKELLAEIDTKNMTPAQALHHAVLLALEAGNQINVLRAECASLRKRIEERGGLSYRGVWKEENVPYRTAELVTHKGCLWHAWKVTSDRPGTSDAWQLMVKHARD